jgi:hypothetical protein
MTTPTPYTVTYDDVVALVRVMENAGRAGNASWFDVAHRVLQGLHNRGIVNYSIPRVDRDSVVQENVRLETQVAGLLAQLQDCQRNLGTRTSELATRTEQLDTRTAALTTCQTELSTCREGRESQ